MRRHRLPQAVRWVLLALGCLAAFAGGRALVGLAPGLTPAAVAAQEGAAPTFAAREISRSGLSGGELLAGDRAVLEIVATASGLSGYERAIIVADRLNRQLQAGARAEDFGVRTMASLGRFVYKGSTTIFTVTTEDAEQAGKSVADLTAMWADSVWDVLPGERPQPQETPAVTETATQSSEWVPEEPYEDRYVPILSILRGVRVGAARINGPRSKVDMVQGVGQLELRFKDAVDIEVYIPMSTKEPGKKIARVQSVGVTGVGDFKF